MCSDRLRRDGRNRTALLQRARAWVELGHLDQAVGDLQEVLALNPEDGATYRAVGELLTRGGELEEASEFFVAALQMDDEDREAQERLFAVQLQLAIEELLAEGVVDAPSSATQVSERTRLAAAPWRAPTAPIEPERSHGLGAPRDVHEAPHRAAQPFGSSRLRADGSAASAAPSWPARRRPTRVGLAEALAAPPQPIGCRAPTSPIGEAGSRSSRHRAATAPVERTRASTSPGAPRHDRAAPPLRRAPTSDGFRERTFAARRVPTAPLSGEEGAPECEIYDESGLLVASLVSAGALTTDDLQVAVEHQRAVGGALPDVLLELGYVSLQELEQVRS
ncbi:MAG: hypothetical protein R3B48_19975 [Kofleriaceae bacterium]